MKPAVTLVCPECRHENEPERVYCHECGARLDRSVLSKSKGQKPEDPQVAARRHLQSMLNPRGFRLRLVAKSFAGVLLAALLVAALVQIFRPVSLPPAPGLDGALAPQVNLDLENLATDPQSAGVRYTESQVNAYLASASKSRKSPLGDYLPVKRVVATLEENSALLTVQRTVYGISLSTQARFLPALRDGRITATPQGEWIGRLPLTPALLPYTKFLFGDALGMFQRELKSLGKVGALEVHDKSVSFAPRSAN